MNSTNSTRVALLSYGDHHHRKVLQLVEEVADESLLIGPEYVNESLGETVAGCDLILIEAQYHLADRQSQAIQLIRASSFAPIVVLIDDKHIEDTLESITVGADAVISLHLAGSAILAHCQALMRRWRTYLDPLPKCA